jgi:hypothetical protein
MAKRSKPSEPSEPSSRRVHCTKCDWTNKRRNWAANTGRRPEDINCPLCDSPVELGTGRPGPRELPPELQRSEFRCRILPGTLEQLEEQVEKEGESVSKLAATILDDWALQRKPPRSTKAKS